MTQLDGAGVMTPLAVVCPACRAYVGRPCSNPRGYLVATHKPRARKWLAALAGDTTAAPEAPAVRRRGARGATPESRARVAQLPPVSSDELVLF